jgi:hypothetical protein
MTVDGIKNAVIAIVNEGDRIPFDGKVIAGIGFGRWNVQSLETPDLKIKKRALGIYAKFRRWLTCSPGA